MRGGRCGALRGGFQWFDDLSPPPTGYRWVYLTDITLNTFDLVGGGRVSFPMPYLERLPEVKVLAWWEHQRRIDDMIEEELKNQKPDKWVAGDEPFLKPYPTIYQYCTDVWSKTAKGIVPRTPCTISFSFFSGSVMLSMNDKDRKRSTNTNGATVEEALGLLEAHVAGGSAPWGYWKN